MTKQEVRRAIGYVRVSTTEERQGAGLEGQRRAVIRYATERGWAVELVEEEASGSTLKARPRLLEALGRLAAREADALIVSSVDRASRSFTDFGSILKHAKDEGWLVVVVDSDLDMTTPIGQAVAGVLAAFAEEERNRIRARITTALAVKRSQGIRLGRPEQLTAHVPMMLRRRAEGASLSDIQRSLRALGVEASLSVISRTLARHSKEQAA